MKLFVIIAVLISFCFVGTQQNQLVPKTFQNKSEIINRFEFIDSFEIINNGQKFFVCYFDYASGLKRVSIHIYTYQENSKYWKLLTSKYTNFSSVNFIKDIIENKLIFSSDSNEIILEVKLDSTDYE